MELTVAEYEPPDGVLAVAAGEVDLALTHAYEPAEPAPPPAGVILEPLLVEELVLVTAPGHALAGGSGRLPVADLAGQPIGGPRTPGRQRIIGPAAAPDWPTP